MCGKSSSEITQLTVRFVLSKAATKALTSVGLLGRAPRRHCLSIEVPVIGLNDEHERIISEFNNSAKVMCTQPIHHASDLVLIYLYSNLHL